MNFALELRLRLARFASSLNVPVSTMSVGRSLCCALSINSIRKIWVAINKFIFYEFYYKKQINTLKKIRAYGLNHMPSLFVILNNLLTITKLLKFFYNTYYIPLLWCKNQCNHCIFICNHLSYRSLFKVSHVFISAL